MPEGKNFRSGSALQGEVFSFQLAYCPVDFQRHELAININSPLKEHINCRSVELVPVNYPGQLFDDDYLSTVPGLYPDRLADFSKKPLRALLGQWRSVWMSVEIPPDCPGGKYPIEITVAVNDPQVKRKVSSCQIFTLEVIPLQLPPQTLTFTNWFHPDCIADYYNCEMLSEKHWELIEKFLLNAAKHGINLLLTPLFTLPLDTGVGLERPTCQLVKVIRRNGNYSFDFTLLDKWFNLARKCGIKEFEMSHFFTQWGAEFTPKIIADVDGAEKRLFGWDVRADSTEYAEFLDAFLPALTSYLKANDMQDKVYFHCSDEPHKKHLKNYCYAAKLQNKYLDGFRIMDAMSDVEFYKLGFVTHPVPIEAKIDDFIEAGVPELWTYYCCGPADIYPNRFITMPSARNRVLGALLYYYNVKGFLHWGFNFYYAQYSTHLIDPYNSTDADGAFPGGDPFIVYPGKNGVVEDSLRHEVFFEALQDHRALQLLEKFVPRQKILKMLDKFADGGKTRMDKYPRGEEKILSIRKKINDMLKRIVK